MRDDRQFAFVRFVDDCLHFLHRHLILIDQLDHIDASFSQRAHFRACVIDALHAPTHIVSARIWFVLNKRTGNVKRWPRYLAFLDPLAHRDACFQRRAQIASARHPAISNCRADAGMITDSICGG